MTIKSKLAMGLWFLFIVILLLGGLGSYYLKINSDLSSRVIKDNYESLLYSRNMMESLDDPSLLQNPEEIKEFEQQLILQEQNITELGEKELTSQLRPYFAQLKNTDPANTAALASCRNLLKKTLYKITDLNMQSIIRKNKFARQDSNDAVLYMAIICTVSILIAFTFILNFPGYIAGPVRELTESIKQIAARDYSQRLHFKSDDEFGELADAFNAMAQKLDEYEHSNLAAIIFQKKRIETIINNMQDAIIGFDENNKILFANHKSVGILGIPEKELLNQYAPDIALKNDLLRSLLNSAHREQPLKIFADGKESYFTQENLQITSDSKLIGHVIILKNITDFKELDAAKTNFIATISHELKTPISSIKMSLKLLEDERVGTVNEEQQKLIAHIKDDSQRLLKITGELLDLTQVETGNIQLHYQKTKPREIIDYASAAMSFQAEQKGVRFEIDCADVLPELNIDMEKTAWVMLNLMANAVRYSPDNSVVKIAATALKGDICFSVTDQGKGIEAKYREKIFDKYFKIPNGGSPGTGLGLAISKEFITAQNGRIWVESEMGKGSTFYFELPVHYITYGDLSTQSS